MTSLRTVIESTPELMALGNDYPAIARWLNEAPLIDNPAPQPVISKPCTVAGLFAVLPAADISLLSQLSDLLSVGQGIADATGMEYGSTPQTMLATLQGLGLSADGVAAVTAELEQTIPDPDWQAQIPGPPRYLGLGLSDPVSPDQVQESLH